MSNTRQSIGPDSLLKAKELALLAGISPQHVGKMAKENGLPREANGQYRLGLAWKFFIEWAVEHAERDDAEESSKARLLASKARLEELKLARELGRTITVDFALAEIEPFLSALRSQLLSVPKKVAPIITDGMTAGEREAIMTKAIHDALRELTSLPDRLRENAPAVDETPEDDSEDE